MLKPQENLHVPQFELLWSLEAQIYGDAGELKWQLYVDNLLVPTACNNPITAIELSLMTIMKPRPKA